MLAVSHVRSVLLGLILSGGCQPVLRAQGSPPLITDDPGTPGDGHWEINVGISTERRAGTRTSELPVIDFNYGVGDRLQLTYEVPYLRLSEDGVATRSGPGASAAGIKWRFRDAGDEALAVSVFPKVEFATPGSGSVDRGLVAAGTTFRLPFQFERDAGRLAFIWQLGRECKSTGDAWFYGLSIGCQVAARLQLAVELAGGAGLGLHRSALTSNFGAAIDLSERTSVLFSVGRELHNHDEPRARFVGYLGLQWRL